MSRGSKLINLKIIKVHYKKKNRNQQAHYTTTFISIHHFNDTPAHMTSLVKFYPFSIDT